MTERKKSRIIGCVCLAFLAAAGVLIGLGISNPNQAHASSAVTGSAPTDTNCSTDDTAALNAWFSAVPDGSTIQFPAGSCYGVTSDLTFNQRNNLTIDGNGGTVELLSGAKSNTQIFALDGGTNITLENVSIVGDNTSTAKGGNSSTCNPSGGDEWEFAVAFNGVNTGNLTNVNARNMCGDFVDMEPYRNPSTKNYDFTQPAKNITVTGGTFSVAGRQGFAPSDVEGAVINGINMSHVAQDGIDLEPDIASESVNNVTIENSTFFNISAAVVANFGTGGGPNDGNITVQNNTETGTINCYPPIWGGNSGYASTPRVGFTVTGNHFSPYGRLANLQLGYSNVTISNNVDSGAQGGGGCGQTEGVLAAGINGLTIQNNNFGPTVSSVSTLDSTTTNVTECGNTTSAGSNLPKSCVPNPGCPTWPNTGTECIGDVYSFATTPGSFAKAEAYLQALAAYLGSLGYNAS